MSFNKWLHRRENGRFPRIGDGDFIMKRIYTSLHPNKAWNSLNSEEVNKSEYGAVFNLEFSPDGNILAAACEKKAIILFDAVAQEQTGRIMNAHSDNVNCIKFLDNRTFATCSDDTTVAIWDIRFLKNRLRSLQGHSNWVKNIEYSSKDKLLVTSGFDGSIFTWDINSHTEEGLVYQKVFNTSGLMRCRISPDCTKLVMCTTGGFLMIIHNLDLNNLHKDICGFRPSIYRLMQMGNQYIPQAAKFDYIFSKKQKRNRVELVTDFPPNNDAEIIHALQIHPDGQSFLSRNISYEDESEWSCIHDIDEELYDITERKTDKRKRKLSDDKPSTSTDRSSGSSGGRRNRPRTVENPGQPSTSTGMRPTAPSFEQIITHNNAIANNSAGIRGTSVVIGPYNSNVANYIQSQSASHGAGTSTSGAYTDQPRSSTPNRPEFVPDIWAAEITIQERAARQARGRQTNSVTGYDFVYAISSGILPMAAENIIEGEDPLNPASNGDTQNPCSEEYIIKNASKLMFYIQESNKGKGFIKEPCFSADGRIICSPYNTGVRLLAYTEGCSEHPCSSEKEKLKKIPKQLVAVKTINTHSDIVLSTSFSPRQPLLVTGCKLGKVTWHYPYL